MSLLIAYISLALGVSFLCSLLEATLLTLSSTHLASLETNKTKLATMNKTKNKNDFLQPKNFLGKRKDLSPEKMLEFVKGFKDSGATILGGCCETTPAHIKSFASLK